MDKEHCLLPWQPDLITRVIRVGVSAPKTYTTDHIYRRKKAGRQAGGLEETSTSALCRRDHLSPLVCGAVKILTDACTEGSQRRFKCHSISCYGAIPSQEFMCRIFSSSSLVVSPGICFIPEKKKKKKERKKKKRKKKEKLKYRTSFAHQINHKVGFNRVFKELQVSSKTQT